jgi:hypothetical protein
MAEHRLALVGGRERVDQLALGGKNRDGIAPVVGDPDVAVCIDHDPERLHLGIVGARY